MKRLALLAVCLLLCGLTLFGQVAIAPTTLPNGIVGEAYSQTFTATSQYGAAATNVFSLLSGTPPSGLNLSPGGTLSGTLTAPGTYVFTVQCIARIINSVFPPLTGTQAFTIVVYPVLAVNPQPPSGGILGVPYTQTLTATGGGGAGTYAWVLSASQPPPGIGLSLAGVLSGTPTAVGTYTFTVQVISDVPGFGTAVATQSFTIVIAAASPLTITGSLGSGAVGVPYSSTLVGAGGYTGGTYTFSVAAGNPPPGTTLSAGGTLAGTPTGAITSNFSVQVASNLTFNGVTFPPITTTQPFNVLVYPGLTINVVIANAGTVSAPYSQTFTATGGAGPATYTWSLAGGSVPPPGLNLSASGVLSGTPTTVGTFSFTVQVFSPISASVMETASQAYSVTVSAIPPVVVTGGLGSGGVGVPYSATLGATGGYTNGAYAFSLVSGTPPPGTNLSAGGTLSGTPTAAGTFNFTVQAASTVLVPAANFPPLTGTQSFAIVVYPVLAIPPQTASPGSVGTAYSQTFMATGGAGSATYAWSLANGTPPPGLTLSPAGVLSGTPTAVGTFSFTIQVSTQVPSVGTQIASQLFTIAIGATSSIAITGSLAGGVVGLPYSATLGATGGFGAGTYTFSLAAFALPAGLTLSPGGVLSGTPTTAGTSVFTVQVSSALNSAAASFPPLTASQSFAITVYPALAITSQTASAGSVGTAYSQVISATGGAGSSTYTWSLASGTLPPGLALSPAGVLSGIPTTAGTSSFTIHVSSQIPNVGVVTASQAFSIAIAAVSPPAITGTVSGSPVGVPYSGTLAATGGYGAGTYTFTLLSGTLPPGVTLSTGGTLSGTPTAAGLFNFTVQIVSAQANLPPLTATQYFGITITPVFAITGNFGAGAVGVYYAATVVTTGGYGEGSYSYSVLSGTVPPGLTFIAGILSGTPTAPGTFTFTVQATNTQPNLPVLTATQSFSVAIAPAALAITGTLNGGTVGVPYSATLGATGGYGTGTYTFSLASGTLPLDMTLSPGGILSGVPTAVGTSSFTVQVTSTQTGQPLTATQPFTLTVSVLPAPPVTISGLPQTPTPATQFSLGVTTGSNYPIAIQGTITLAFAPSSGPDDPNVQFTTGGRTAAFLIPAGSTLAQFPGNAPNVQTGTVAGTITLTLDLMAAGVDITPTPAPTQVLVVARSAPVITSATATPTSGGFNLSLVGYSTTRDMVSAAITFVPAAGVTLASNSITVPLSQVFTTWYQSTTSAPFGSMFSLEIPFTIQNGTNALTSLSVALTNSQGSSAAVTAVF